jgi:NitT/TauT family transport system substrate-binding protein
MGVWQGLGGSTASLAVLGATVLLLAACSARPAAPSQPAAPSGSAPTAAEGPAQATRPAPLVSVRYATQQSVTDAAVFLAHARGYFQQEGLDLELVNFSSSNDMVPALATGQLEVGATAPIASFFNAFSSGVEIKTVAERASNLPGHGFVALVVRKDLVDSGRFRDFADLKGLNVGMTPPLWGSGTSGPLLAAMDRGGLTTDDVNGTALPTPELALALRNGSLDAVMIVEPFVTNAVGNGSGVRWKGVDEFYAGHMLSGISYAPSFAAQQPEAARGFMVAYVRAAREYNTILRTGASKDELVGLLAEYSTLKDRAVIDRMVLHGVKPDPYIDRESVARDLEFFLRVGVVKERVAIDRLVDDQYVKYAADKLGKYE